MIWTIRTTACYGIFFKNKIVFDKLFDKSVIQTFLQNTMALRLNILCTQKPLDRFLRKWYNIQYSTSWLTISIEFDHNARYNDKAPYILCLFVFPGRSQDIHLVSVYKYLHNNMLNTNTPIQI